MSIPASLRHAFLALVAMAALPAGAASAAPSEAEIFDLQLADYQKDARIKFRDDHTDVGGKGYELAKATIDWFGVPGEVLDVADFARSVKNEGIGLHNTSTLIAKIVASRVSTKQFESIVKKMDEKELLEIAKRVNLGTTGDLQKAVLEYLTETAPNVAAQVSEGTTGDAATTLFLDVVTKMCKTCGLAQKSYEFAVEASMAAEIAFDNENTQSMFSQMAHLGYHQFADFQTEYVMSDVHKNEARKALTLAYQAAGRKEPPTEEEVDRYIFDRYQRWQSEIQTRAEDAAVLAELKGDYLKLLRYEKEAIFGPGTEADWASRYMASYIGLYNGMVAMKGDRPWPFGLGREEVRFAVHDLLKRRKSGKLTDEELGYEMRKLAAKWGWIPESKVGPPPPKPAPVVVRPQEPREIIEARIWSRLPNLNHAKLTALAESRNISLPTTFMHCLCQSRGIMGAGLGYHPEPWGDCDNNDPCKGGNWGCASTDLPHDRDTWQICIDEQKARGERTLIDILADEVEALRAEQGAR